MFSLHLLVSFNVIKMNFLTHKLLLEEELRILKNNLNKKNELWENGKKTAGSFASKVKEKASRIHRRPGPGWAPAQGRLGPGLGPAWGPNLLKKIKTSSNWMPDHCFRHWLSQKWAQKLQERAGTNFGTQHCREKKIKNTEHLENPAGTSGRIPGRTPSFLSRDTGALCTSLRKSPASLVLVP